MLVDAQGGSTPGRTMAQQTAGGASFGVVTPRRAKDAVTKAVQDGRLAGIVNRDGSPRDTSRPTARR